MKVALIIQATFLLYWVFTKTFKVMGENQIKTNPHTLDEIEKEITRIFEEIMNEYFPKRRENGKSDVEKTTRIWITDEIKKRIKKLGEKSDYDTPEKEFLYDLSWCKYENDILDEMILALESELSSRSTDGLREDFNKLLVVNVKYRVFICFEYNKLQFPESVNKLIDDLQESFDKCKNLNNESRLLLLVCDDYNNGKVYPYLMIK